MKIKITPLDNLFFRDGKPFNKGEDNWADTLYLPYVSTVYGAIRSKYFSENMDVFDFANTEKDPTKNLKITGFYLIINNTILFPMPLDLIYYKEGNIKKHESENLYPVYKMRSTLNENIYSSLHKKYNLRELFLVEKDAKVETLENAYLKDVQMEKYFNNKINSKINAQKISKNMCEESKIGIAKNNKTGSAQESMLYRINQVRYDGISIVVEFEGIDIEEKGILKLGGKGNVVKYEQIDVKDKLLDKDEKQYLCNRLKMYMLTPGIFENGWIPDFINEDTLEGTLNGIRVKLINAAIGKHQNISGYDMKKNRPKPMKRAVPQGSVYIFEIEEVYRSNLVEKLIINSFNQDQGYGISYCNYYYEE